MFHYRRCAAGNTNVKRLEKLVAECPGSYIKAGMVSHGFGVNGEADNYEGKGKVKTPTRKVFSRWAAVLTRSHPMPRCVRARSATRRATTAAASRGPSASMATTRRRRCGRPTPTCCGS